MQFHLFLPQMRLSLERMVEVARAAEAAGFNGMAGMDHLVPPLAESQPMYEAMIANTWLAAHTSRLTLGSLVLCDAMRHPAVLAREAKLDALPLGGSSGLDFPWPDYNGCGTLAPPFVNTSAEPWAKPLASMVLLRILKSTRLPGRAGGRIESRLAGVMMTRVQAALARPPLACAHCASPGIDTSMLAVPPDIDTA